MYHVPLALQCMYGYNDGGENVDGEEESKSSRGVERVEIAWPLVCRSLGIV